MRASAALLTVVGTAVGAVTAVVAYQAGAGGAIETASSGKDQVPETTTVAPTSTVPTFLPCKKGTKLRKGVCVRVKKKVIVVFDPAPVVPAAGLAPATSARTGYTTGHDSGDDRTRARSGPGAGADEHADRDDRDETEHSEDHESEDSDEVEDHGEDGHEVEPED